jgi:hypothetical protein
LNTPTSRRDFLKLSLLSLSTLAFNRIPSRFFPDDLPCDPIGIARVTARVVNIYEKASYRSSRRGVYYRDQMIVLLKELISYDGPEHNLRWYQTMDGYIHSGYMQRITPVINTPTRYLPPKGQLGELTTASIESMSYTNEDGWFPRYRMYYSSLHWITGRRKGPDGTLWYEITDDLLRLKHYIPAKYIRLLKNNELQPISPECPPHEKRIEVSIENQTLTAFERNQVVFHTKVSTGLPMEGEPPEGEIPTDTPTGRHYIVKKMPSRHMGDGEITNLPEGVELIGVPWVSYFHKTGVAFHGTFWHDNFGKALSHGCVNLRNEDAKWLYLWTTPVVGISERYRLAVGTKVDVI